MELLKIQELCDKIRRATNVKALSDQQIIEVALESSLKKIKEELKIK